ncbi:hypothetical protein AAEH85_21675, partial [Shewanella algae]|uniref:hypothetical protein n=1 Tax=Shewanella algae TaxID=38313 RepID=UPI00313B5FF8
ELQYILRHSKARFAVCGDQEQTDKVIEAASNGEGLPDLLRTICVDMKGMVHYRTPGLMSFADVLDLGAAEEARHGATVDQLLAGLDPDA